MHELSWNVSSESANDLVATVLTSMVMFAEGVNVYQTEPLLLQSVGSSPAAIAALVLPGSHRRKSLIHNYSIYNVVVFWQLCVR